MLLVESTLLACIPAGWAAAAGGDEDVVPLSPTGVPDALAESPEPLGAAAEDCEESATGGSELLAVSPTPRLAGCGATVAGAALWVPSVDGPAIWAAAGSGDAVAAGAGATGLAVTVGAVASAAALVCLSGGGSAGVLLGAAVGGRRGGSGGGGSSGGGAAAAAAAAAVRRSGGAGRAAVSRGEAGHRRVRDGVCLANSVRGVALSRPGRDRHGGGGGGRRGGRRVGRQRRRHGRRRDQRRGRRRCIGDHRRRRQGLSQTVDRARAGVRMGLLRDRRHERVRAPDDRHRAPGRSSGRRPSYHVLPHRAPLCARARHNVARGRGGRG